MKNRNNFDIWITGTCGDANLTILQDAAIPRFELRINEVDIINEFAPVDEICELAKCYGAKVMIDDAHVFFAVGQNGGGTASTFNCVDKVDIHYGTFSKALGAIGGFCAARASDVGRRINFEKTNFTTVKNLANMCLRLNIERFVYVSTTDVYGLKDFKSEDEETLDLDICAKNYYPMYKIKSEQWLQAEMPAERFAIVRPAAVWGIGDHTLTPRIVDYLKSLPVIFHFGKWRGKNRWPLAHVKNVAKALYAAAILPEAGGKAVNVLDNESTTINEFYYIIRDLYLPDRKLREISLPVAMVYLPAWFSSFISTLFNLKTPLYDPSLYALDTIRHDLNFSNQRFQEWLKASNQKITTRAEGLDELRMSKRQA